MQAFVTGGTGFIGANLVAGLGARGIKTRVLHRSSSSMVALDGLAFEGIEGDILDETKQLARAMAGCQWVFHTAAVSDYWRKQKEQIYRVNVEGTRNVLDAAKMAGVERFVFTSSLSALGVPKPGTRLSESSQFNLRPDRWPYAHSKVLAEAEVNRAQADGLEVVIVNPSVVLGPRDVNMISGSIIVEAARGLARFYPPGGTNYIDVEDVVAGHIAAAEKGRPGERYILAAHNVLHREVLEIVCRIVGRRPPIMPIPKAGLPAIATLASLARKVLGNRVPFDPDQVRLSGRFIYADNQKATTELGMPLTPFEQSVQTAFDWYNKNGYLPRS